MSAAKEPITTTPDVHPHEVAYEAWRMNPNQDTLAEAVKHLEPSMHGVLRQMNLAQNPIAVSKARVLVGRAVRTYSPDSGAGLPTWVNRQLQPMRRFSRTNLTSVRVPERMQLDALTIHKAEQEFIDKHQREPDLLELADHSKIPVRRISEIRKTFRKNVAEGSMIDDQGSPTGLSAQSAEDPLLDEAIEYVYHDSDAVDRRLLEMKTGYGGKYDPMDHAAISAALRIPPATVSRRAVRVGLKIQQIHSALRSATNPGS